jgi:hypothetical protein
MTRAQLPAAVERTVVPQTQAAVIKAFSTEKGGRQGGFERQAHGLW